MICQLKSRTFAIHNAWIFTQVPYAIYTKTWIRVCQRRDLPREAKIIKCRSNANAYASILDVIQPFIQHAWSTFIMSSSLRTPSPRLPSLLDRDFRLDRDGSASWVCGGSFVCVPWWVDVRFEESVSSHSPMEAFKHTWVAESEQLLVDSSSAQNLLCNMPCLRLRLLLRVISVELLVLLFPRRC